jgi:hypothetical protein
MPRTKRRTSEPLELMLAGNCSALIARGLLLVEHALRAPRFRHKSAKSAAAF